MNGFFNECDRLGAELTQRSADWKQPARVPNMRAAAFLGACYTIGVLLAVVL